MTWRERLPEVRRIAESLGLQPPDLDFHVVPAEEIYALAATGLPGMYPHWSHGRDYELQRTAHDRGRQRIYELVFNLAPVQAYLLDSNLDEDHVFVAAHVLGHADLFRRNTYCRHQRLDIVEVLREARARFTEYEHEYGQGAVEEVVDAGHMLRWHSTREELGEIRRPVDPRPDPYRVLFQRDGGTTAMRWKVYRDERRGRERSIGERDLIRFLVRHAPLEPWQRDVLGIVREVALYFLPSIKVKVLHEGYASWVHKRILRALPLRPSGTVHDALLNAGVVGSPGNGQLPNPYWLGNLILEGLTERGSDILELIRDESDWSLIGRLDERICRDNAFLREALRQCPKDRDELRREPWQQLRDRLLANLPNMPEVEVQVRDWDATRVVLETPVAVDRRYATEVLAAIARLWQGRASLVAPGQEITEGVPA